MAQPGLGSRAQVAHSEGEEILVTRRKDSLMGTDMTLLRQRLQGERRKDEQWQVYRWIGLCAMLVIACLVILSLVY